MVFSVGFFQIILHSVLWRDGSRDMGNGDIRKRSESITIISELSCHSRLAHLLGGALRQIGFNPPIALYEKPDTDNAIGT
jgi:hypothetical protein